MKLSIVLPVYNVDKYLSVALDSLINQTYRDIEIICIDDGSTDDSAKILYEYSLKDSRINVITQKNAGTYMARRRGVEASHGDYIMFVDPDDWIDLDACATISNALDNKRVDILQYGFKIEVDGKISSKRAESIDYFFNRSKKSLMGREQLLTESYLNETITYNQCGKVFCAEVAHQAFAAMPPVRCIYAEDMCTAFFLFYFANSYCSISQRFYHYRVGIGISTKSVLSLSEYTRTLDSFKMLEAIDCFVVQNHLSATTYAAVIEKIGTTMVCASYELGFNRIGEDCQIEDWLTPLCEATKLPNLARIFVKRLVESSINLKSRLEIKIARKRRQIKLLALLNIFLLILLMIVFVLWQYEV